MSFHILRDCFILRKIIRAPHIKTSLKLSCAGLRNKPGMRELKSPKVCDCTNLAAQEHIHQISVFPVNDWSGGAQAGHLENISLERRGPFVD